MRIVRSSVETPNFDNLLIPTGTGQAGRREPAWLPDPFADATSEVTRPIEPRADRVEPFPSRPLGPYRPYWRESTFLRAVGLPYDRCLTALCAWGRSGVIELRRGRLVVPPALAQHPSRYSLPARLRRRAPWSLAVPMELELVPWSQTLATTWLALCPRRRVHLGRRYFEAGHALLDQLTAGLLLHAD